MFDLPTKTSTDMKNYRDFRKFLLTRGFVQLQESIYTKIALNGTATKAIKKQLRENKPSEGRVDILVVTERQYNSMEIW